MTYITGDTHREFYKLHNIEKTKIILLQGIMKLGDMLGF